MTMLKFTPKGSTNPGLVSIRTIGRHYSSTRGGKLVGRAGGFDEGAAQVRRLLDRDRKDIDLDELEKSFDSNESRTSDGKQGQEAGAQEGGVGGTAPFRGDATKKLSPFGPSSGAGSASPFESQGAKSPFESQGRQSLKSAEAVPMDQTPWWKKITVAQIVIVLSFTTIIGLMIATFFFVLNVGAIRLNE